MDSSWSLLSDDERRLLLLASVFSGSWTLAAAEGVCGGIRSSVAGTLRSLVAKSLIESTPARPLTRYRMLETVRLYARQQLDPTGIAPARARHLAWFTDWVQEVPVDAQMLSVAWASRLLDDINNITAAVEWAINEQRWDAGALLTASTAGASFLGLAPSRTLAWAETLLSRELSPEHRGRLLLTGALAAVHAGRHDRLTEWSLEVEKHEGDVDRRVLCLALLGRAAPLLVPEPVVAESLLTRAEQLAADTGSKLCRGAVNAWRLMHTFASDPGLVEVRPVDAERFGGRDSIGWIAATQTGVIAHALAGRADEAHELIRQFSSLDPAARITEEGFTVAVEAIGGDVARALTMASSFIEDVDRWSDVVWHGELVTLLGICRLRSGDPLTALVYLSAGRRAPMRWPFWYTLAQLSIRQAEQDLEPSAAATTIAAGRAEPIESVLDRELRQRI
jgi:hypothetical protein